MRHSPSLDVRSHKVSGTNGERILDPHMRLRVLIQPWELAVYLVLHVYHRRSWQDRSSKLPLPQPPLMLS